MCLHVYVLDDILMDIISVIHAKLWTGTVNDSTEYCYLVHTECLWYEQVPEMTVSSIAIWYIPNVCNMYRNLRWQYRVLLCGTYRMFIILRMNARMWCDRIWYWYEGYDSHELYDLLCVLIFYVVHVWWCCYSLSGDSYKSPNFSRLLVETSQITGLSTQTDRLIASSSLILILFTRTVRRPSVGYRVHIRIGCCGSKSTVK